MSAKMRWRYFKKAKLSGDGSEQNDDRRMKPRMAPPEGLKGKEIGLWYREQKRKAKEANKHEVLGESSEVKLTKWRKDINPNAKPVGSIFISENKKSHINKILNESESLYPSTFMEKDDTYEHLEETHFKHEFLQHITGSILEKLQSAPISGSDYKNDHLDEFFLKELTEKEGNRSYREMINFRKKLPSMGMKDEILDVIDKNQVSVLSGETGCGKTTQVAQFILDDFIKKGKGSECRIVCTQPRRISAISVAERVARERDEKLGNSVGYQIRLEKTLPRERGSILYCTTGVLLKYMESNPTLNEFSHLILDEIHERDVISDFLITLLKDVIHYRSDLKVILMSATLNSEAFSKYYNNAPHLSIPGFTFPVEEYFLEDVLELTKAINGPVFQKRSWNKRRHEEYQNLNGPYLRQLESEKKYSSAVIERLWHPKCEQLDLNLIFNLLNIICAKDNDDGAILIFVPGFVDIQKLIGSLKDSGCFPPVKYIIIPLHSQLPTVDQKQIFNRAPKGMRKIIVSTNIAETSITIDDVTTVIDCGYIKISKVDPETNIETLLPEFVSQANAAQRKGRAGRVKPGVCYHLVTRYRYDTLDKFLLPEVLRKRLDDVVLSLKMLQLGEALPFLTRLMDPPEHKLVELAIELLQRLGALDSDERLTPLGYHMGKLPVQPQCSKMLIMAALFGCVEPVLSIAATLGFKDSFQLSTEQGEADKKRAELAHGVNSDHLLMYYAIKGFEDSGLSWSFCRRYYLSASTLKLLIEMRKQFAQHLYDMKFISERSPKHPSNNINSDNIGLIKAIVTSGLYPNIALVRNAKKRTVFARSLDNHRVTLHPKSVLYQTMHFPSPLLVYYLRLKSQSDYLHDASVVFPLPIVFFGDRFKIHKPEEEDVDTFTGVSVNNLRFLCSESSSVIIRRLRDRLNQILEWKVCHPKFVNWARDTPETRVLRVIMDMISSEDSENMDLSDFDDM